MLFLIPSAPAVAGPGGALAIPALASQADAVVVGAPAQVPAPGDASVALTITRVLKGDLELTTITATWPSVEVAGDTGEDLHGLWFLEQGADGQWTIVPVSAGSLLARDMLISLPRGDLPIAYQYAAADPVIDKIVDELRAAVPTSSGNEAVLSRVYDALGTITRPGAGLAYQHIAELGPEHVPVCPTVRLVQEWGRSTVELVQQQIQLGRGVPPGVLASLCSVADPAALPGLGGLLDAVGVGPGVLQRCVAKALRNVHTESALPQLSRLLESPDPEIQYLGLNGLALFANNHLPGDEGRDRPAVGGPWTTPGTQAHSPSAEEFDSDRERYIEYWRSWSDCVPCRLDDQPPLARVTAPAEGALLSKTVLLEAEASDNVGVAAVGFAVDGVRVGSEIATAPYRSGWDTSGVTDGVHSLTALARDRADNVTTSAPVTITVDNTPPAINLSAAPRSMWPPTNKLIPVKVTVNVKDTVDPTPTTRLVSITANEPLAPSDIADAAYGTDDREFRLRASRSGSGAGRLYTIAYEVTDAAGNKATGTTTVTVLHDQGH